MKTRIKSKFKTFEINILTRNIEDMKKENAQAEAKVKMLRGMVRELCSCSRSVLDNAHWEVRFGSGDLANALTRADQLLSETGGGK